MVNVDYSKAYNYIRERILSREYRTGQPLRPDLLAVELGMSRTPIRDALRQLDADGLVSIRPRLGAFVRVIDADEFQEICGLRMALEIFAVGLAAQLRTEPELREITAAHESIAAEIEGLIAASGLQASLQALTSEHLVREELRFHVAITTAAKNRLIKREILRQHLVNRIVGVSAWVQLDIPTPSNREEAVTFMRSTVSEHKAICDAIRRKDSTAAKYAMELHLQQDVDAMLRRMARGEAGQIAGELAISGSNAAGTRVH